MSSPRPRGHIAHWLTPTLVAVFVLAIPSWGQAESSRRDTPTAGTVTVFAASSLTAAFRELEVVFEAANPKTTLTLNFGGSSTLVTQILNGAPADVFASADSATMSRLVRARRAGSPQIFTRNKLMIVVPKGNPGRIASLADLSRPGVVVALGGPGVPAGEYGRQILDRAGVKAKPKSLEANVGAIVAKAALREIDAGIVYATDVAAAKGVQGIVIPDTANLVASYPIAIVEGARNRTAAESFVRFVRSPLAQGILREHGFLRVE